MERGREIGARPSDIHVLTQHRERPANCRARGHVLLRSAPLRALSGPIQWRGHWISSWQPVPVTRIRVQLVRSCAKTPSNHGEWGSRYRGPTLAIPRDPVGRSLIGGRLITGSLRLLLGSLWFIDRLFAREKQVETLRAANTSTLIINRRCWNRPSYSYTYGMRSLIPRLIWLRNRFGLALIHDHSWRR